MFRKKALCSAILAASAISHAHAQLEEVIVTATKREASAQDIPVPITALGQDTLDRLSITDFSDYLVQLPGLTAGGGGPGTNTIYIRGVASTTPNISTSGVAGLAPNVALYLDEQPLTQPGRNLDVYTADLNRVEVLKGPQGTLFGASSQAGTVRLITNKPDPSGFSGSLKVSAAHTPEGEPSHNAVGVVNIPLSEDVAVRAVAYADSQGGYIDNVRGTQSTRSSRRFENIERFGGTGKQPNPDFTNVNFIDADNGRYAEDDFNEATWAGFRIAALWNINDSWSALLGASQQTIDSEGVFFQDPDMGDLEISRFEDDTLEDSHENLNWTLRGRMDLLDVIYTGAYTERESEGRIDYSDYLFSAEYLPYYICDRSVTYPEENMKPSGTCYQPALFVGNSVKSEFQTHEFRITADPTDRLNVVGGVFYSDMELGELNNFTYSSSVLTLGADGSGPGWAPNYSILGDSRPTVRDTSVWPAGVIWRNDVLRTDEQLGVFGELSFSLTDAFFLTLGARWYDVEVDLLGFAGGSWNNRGKDVDENTGNNLDVLFSSQSQVLTMDTNADDVICDTDAIDKGEFTDEQNMKPNPCHEKQADEKQTAEDVAQTDGVIGKLSLSWVPTDGQLFYITWSEGFRPGILNRPGGNVSEDRTYAVPIAVDTDDVVNYEFGWKLDLLDNTLRFNGDIFYVDVANLQINLFDPSISNLFFSDNAADAEVKGVEGDFVWAATPQLTLGGGFSWLDTEVTDSFVTRFVREGDELAFAPEFQFSLNGRYEWRLPSGMDAYVMSSLSYSDEANTDIVAEKNYVLDSWTLWNAAFGVAQDEWSAELFVENLTDERAEISGNFIFNRPRVTVARPRTFGLRFSYGF